MRLPVALLAALYAPAWALPLPPPTVRSRAAHRGDANELIVHVAPGLSLIVLEADMSTQEALVDAALEATEAPGTASEDPYGVVLWPAAQVVAAAVVALPGSLVGRRVVELGAGTGLCSLAAAAHGAASVLATDYRPEPLALLRRAAEASAGLLGRPLTPIETGLFDIKSEMPLPPADVYIAADLLYLQSTSVALGRRCAEALRAGCELVLVGDTGRPGRSAFLEALVEGGVRPDRAVFEAVEGWGAPTPRHELISSAPEGAGEGAAPAGVSVGLLRLTPADLG